MKITHSMYIFFLCTCCGSGGNEEKSPSLWAEAIRVLILTVPTGSLSCRILEARSMDVKDLGGLDCSNTDEADGRSSREVADATGSSEHEGSNRSRPKKAAIGSHFRTILLLPVNRVKVSL